MTREDAIKRYVIPACERMWNEKTCQKIMEILKEMSKGSDKYTEDTPAIIETHKKNMTNAELFWQIFGRYATEVWSMSENEFLDWLNSSYRGRMGNALLQV